MTSWVRAGSVSQQTILKSSLNLPKCTRLPSDAQDQQNYELFHLVNVTQNGPWHNIVSVCARARMCVRVVCAYVRACMRACVHACMYACVYVQLWLTHVVFVCPKKLSYCRHCFVQVRRKRRFDAGEEDARLPVWLHDQQHRLGLRQIPYHINYAWNHRSRFLCHWLNIHRHGQLVG